MKKEVKNSKTKKVNTSEKKNRQRNAETDLGAYGLEPPKLYRKDQKLTGDSKSDKNKKSAKKNAPKTIQQQRLEENKKRKKKKITRKIILWLALVLGIAGVIVVLSLTVLFKIQTITIQGTSKYSNQEILAVLPIEKEKNLFLSDTASAEAKLEENLPYIYDAEIKRKLPSTIIVNITKTPKIFALKNKDKTYTLLDDNFKVLEASVQKKPKNSILIKKAALSSAVNGKKAVFTNDKIEKNLSLMVQAEKEMKLEKITEIYSVDINNNYMVYDSRITIKLGSTDSLEDKLYSAFAAIEKLEEQNPLAEGTMTVGSGKKVYFTES